MKLKNDNNLRITISINKEHSKDIEFLMDNLKVSKSEIFKIAFENFLEDYKKKNLKKIAEMMRDEYKNNNDLNSFSSLDGEDFL